MPQRGSSLGPEGWIYEHWKIPTDEMDVFDLVFEAASSVAQGRVPADIQEPLMSAMLTALSKDDGGVRGIATGCTFRRLNRSLARQFVESGWDRRIRAAMMDRWITMPKVQFLLLFIQMSYTTPSSYSWFDDEGRRRVVTGRGGRARRPPDAAALLSWSWKKWPTKCDQMNRSAHCSMMCAPCASLSAPAVWQPRGITFARELASFPPGWEGWG